MGQWTLSDSVPLWSFLDPLKVEFYAKCISPRQLLLVDVTKASTVTQKRTEIPILGRFPSLLVLEVKLPSCFPGYQVLSKHSPHQITSMPRIHGFFMLVK